MAGREWPPDARTASAWAGALAPVVAFSGIVAAIAVSPSFSLTRDPLSNLGAVADPAATGLTRTLFNGGLIVAGLLGVVFCYALWAARENLIETAGVVVFGATMAAMAGVGVFPQGTELHFWVAVRFYLLLSVSLWVYGAGNYQAGHERRGVLTLALGVLNLLTWVAWATTGSLTRPGLAIPETVGALVLAVWALWTARWHIVGERAPV
ncbi:MAG: DUF998 domain-containing protein [Haloarculaceae archaeon]